MLQYFGPVIITFALFITLSVANVDFTVSQVYTSYAILNIVRLPISLLPMAKATYSEAISGLNRMNEFLLCEDVKLLPKVSDSVNGKKVLVSLENASFQWKDPKEDLKVDTKKPIYTEVNDLLIDLRALNIPNFNLGDFPSFSKPFHVQSNKPVGDKLLQNLSFQILEGDFIAVIGTVGSGKSSLMAAILGNNKNDKFTI